MFKSIFLFELRYRAKRPATYLYFLILLALGYFTMLGMGQFFGGAHVSVGGSGGKTLVNSPFVLNQVISGLSLFAVLIIAAIMGNPIYRDFDHRTHALLYSYPMSKFSYLGGRFAGSLVITLFVLTGLAFGAMLGTITPGVNAEKFGPFMLMAYIQPYLIQIIPNALFLGAIFFCLTTLTREVLATYLGSVIFLVLYIVAATYMEDLDNKTLSSLLDPFGSFAVENETKYWSVAQKNAQLVPFTWLLAVNRLIWLSAGLVLFMITFKRFRFSHFLTDRKKKKTITDKADKGLSLITYAELVIPKVKQVFNFRSHWRIFGLLTKFEFRQIIRSVYFIAIASAGMILLFANSVQIGKMYGTSTYPVTYQVIGMLSGTFALFFLIIITFYSGELVWRERSNKVSEITDSLPVPGWIFFTSKLSALMLIQVFLLSLIFLAGIIIQTVMGYFNYEIIQYIKALFGFQLIDLLLLCVLSMFIQVIVNHKFMGYAIVIVYYLFDIFFMESVGLEHNLYDFASDVGSPYSDMNGYGHFVWPYFVYKLYWAAFAVLLAVISNLFWVRGTASSFKQRWLSAKDRWSSSAIAAISAVLVFVLCGSFIYYNTNVLNEYKSSDDEKEESAAFEKLYGKYAGIAQPRITGVKLNVDIYPEQRDFYFKGTYVLKNKTDRPIDSIHINLNNEAVINEISFERDYTAVLSDETFGYYIYQLKKPLQEGESIVMKIDLAYETKGFRNSRNNGDIVYNGTFINSSYLPSIGYSGDAELDDEDDRKKYGLTRKERLPKVNDKRAVMNNYVSQDADWITFETTVSTSPDQIAIAPGYLQKEWTENDRRYFHYKMDANILNFYAFQSARYEVLRDKWKDVNIEIYYQKGHEYNLERMVLSIKKSLAYFSENFSPYQHKQARIIEFPRYQTFAQSFPNTIPYSEAIGFIAKVNPNDLEDVDYPFYITAHEIAHQWWAHQVIGGKVQGMTLMSESMAQYSALMVMEEEFGKEQMRKFLEYELDNYLEGRSFERRKELPLILNENQMYIHYNKGSLVMYALKDYIGEDSLNSALRKYIAATAFQEPPYTTSMEFLSYIKAATPDSLQYIIEDMFETITLYENKTEKAEYRMLDSNHYEVKFTIEANKYRADSLGNEKEIPINDWIDIAVLGREKNDGKWKEKELYFRKHLINKKEMSFTFVVDEKPFSVGIDPYCKLIDRHSEDNIRHPEKIE